ncbi:MAG: hypothetical protein KAX31_04070, partial [Thermoplasmata archaeon]|nr:hypothetical protein [Thermoplasmata archaeon]
TSAGSVGEVRRDDIVAMITPRLATETPVTIAVYGTFDDVPDWGNMTVTVAAIGDLPTSNIVVDFFIAEEHNSEIEVRNNPIDGVAANEDWSDKNYYMNKVGRRWAGMGEPNDGGPWFLYNKTDTVTYVDVPFDDHWQWGGASMGWIGTNLWLVGTVINGDTGEVLQTSAFSIGNPTPDLYMTPVDIYTPTIGTVVNETVHGPTVEGGTGPLSLDYGNIIDCTMYIDIAGTEWMKLQEDADYFLDYATGTIDTSPIEPFEAGWTFYAYYNYTLPPPNEGDIQPFDVTVSNTGNGPAGASTLEITDGDGGPLVDTLAIPALAAGESTTQVWAFDTAGYPGFITLCFIPDGPDAIAESDENNNIAPYDIYIAPPIDVGVASIDSHADGGSYEWGGTTILATVRNYGSAAQGPFNVQCTVMEGATTIL